MKSTKVTNAPGGCIVQITTQQRNPDKTYVLNVHMDISTEPRKLVKN